jgi:hypothetical protein
MFRFSYILEINSVINQVYKSLLYLLSWYIYCQTMEFHHVSLPRYTTREIFILGFQQWFEIASSKEPSELQLLFAHFHAAAVKYEQSP